MKQDHYVANLFDTLKDLDNAVYHLKRSFNKCISIGIKNEYQDEEFDNFETLTSRYARVIDMIVQKVFRSIDCVEFEREGTLIDVINRAHKRGLFDSVDELREMKDLRNEIAHEYVTENLVNVFKDVLNYTSNIFTIIKNIETYCGKYK